MKRRTQTIINLAQAVGVADINSFPKHITLTSESNTFHTLTAIQDGFEGTPIPTSSLDLTLANDLPAVDTPLYTEAYLNPAVRSDKTSESNLPVVCTNISPVQNNDGMSIEIIYKNDDKGGLSDIDTSILDAVNLFSSSEVESAMTLALDHSPPENDGNIEKQTDRLEIENDEENETIMH
ncbi:unnamed protein product [Acanthoscelides obtectus]|uniref:Uncharacterized protein n=1 Tax=Acanthoscelides obtectus TaxID=200917 RepID=A0A9P0PL44_ACAOB|nr:unnamed protein product [Acanthoscelides obtectus]CAK1624590.1 hypothetical protein AOBTE_LOCUS2628 [Acanthoscelides obtectus]